MNDHQKQNPTSMINGVMIISPWQPRLQVIFWPSLATSEAF